MFAIEDMYPLLWAGIYPTGTSPTDADAIAAATVQTSAVIVYTLYDSSWSQEQRGLYS